MQDAWLDAITCDRYTEIALLSAIAQWLILDHGEKSIMTVASLKKSPNSRKLIAGSRGSVAKVCAQAEAYTKRHTRSKKAARDALVRLGTHTKTGRLTKAYKQ